MVRRMYTCLVKPYLYVASQGRDGRYRMTYVCESRVLVALGCGLERRYYDDNVRG